MKKNLLLSFCLLCTSAVSACSNSSLYSSNNTYLSQNTEETPVVIDTTIPQAHCSGISGSCNDTPLINYTKTEADYRAYNERTKRDHLYTQSGVGNNLTATIRPDVEDDIVTSNAQITKETIEENIRQHMIDDGVFSDTGTLEFETPSEQYTQLKNNQHKSTDSINTPTPQKDTDTKVGRADNVITQKEKEDAKNKLVIKTVTEEDGAVYEIVCEDEACTEVKKIKQTLDGNESKYEIICEENCEEIMSANADDDTITSEFTEESFDIADYVDMEGADTNIEFNEIGAKEQLVADVSIDEIKISDDTILTWEAEEGDNLRELLTKWCEKSGWKLLWNTNRNYVLSAGVMFKGKFADVSSALIRAFARARPAPIATYYKGNRVIVVETMENENAY